MKDYVATIHSFLTAHESPKKGSTDLALNAAGKIITPSRRIAKSLEAWLGESHPSIITVPNCVDVQKFKPMTPHGMPRKRLSIAYVGRLDSDKLDLTMMVKTLERLRSIGLPFRLEIAGDGELKNQLSNTLRRRHLDHFVAFRGFINNVGKVYSKADVVFFPSLNEGLSIAALEAMAMGRVVLATDVGDMSLLASEGGAIIVPPGGFEEAVSAFELVNSDEQTRRRIEVKAREFALNHSVELWSKEILRVFRSMLSQQVASPTGSRA